jgi:hypothetical protein
MNRRDWLTKTSLALAGGLVLGDAVMEQYERLTHTKVFALGAMQGHDDYFLSYGDIMELLNHKMVTKWSLGRSDSIYLANIYPNA